MVRFAKVLQSAVHALILRGPGQPVKPRGSPLSTTPGLAPGPLILLLLTGCAAGTPLCPPCQQCPQLGRYQLQRDTGRTWRLDTVTGDICLMLASEADWKKPDIQAQGCL